MDSPGHLIWVVPSNPIWGAHNPRRSVVWLPLALSQRASFLRLAPLLVPGCGALFLALGGLASVSSLFCSPADRLEAANNRLGPCATASVPAPLLLRTALLEWFAGVGTMSHAFRHHGVRTHAQAEQDELKQRVLRHFFPLSVLVSGVFDSFLLPLVASVLIAAGIPCQPVAPPSCFPTSDGRGTSNAIDCLRYCVSRTSTSTRHDPWWALHLTAHPDGGLPLP